LAITRIGGAKYKSSWNNFSAVFELTMLRLQAMANIITEPTIGWALPMRLELQE
jgi:hypothetical protein